MTDVTVVLLPAATWQGRDAVAAELVGRGIPVYAVADVELPEELPERLVASRTVALWAIELNAAELSGPIALVAHGDAALLLPTIGFAQRAAHRQVHSYVLLDAPVPTPGQDWPDAPVWWCSGDGPSSSTSEASVTVLQARLRGFEVVESGSAVEAITGSLS